MPDVRMRRAGGLTLASGMEMENERDMSPEAEDKDKQGKSNELPSSPPKGSPPKSGGGTGKDKSSSSKGVPSSPAKQAETKENAQT